jgi:DNA-binding transcriptional ArsR family regulator
MQVMQDERKIVTTYLETGEVLAEIKAHGLPWDFTPDGRIPSLDRWLQVRNIEQFALPMQIKKYKSAYLRGRPVPPIVVTIDGVGIDGANRVGGALDAGLSVIPQFRIRIAYEEATESQRRQLKELGAALNNKHGLGMSKANNNRLVRELAKDGRTVKEMAAELNISESQVSSVLAEDKGMSRLVNLGIKVEDGLQPSHVQKLGWKSPQLNNPVMRAVAELTRDSRLSVGELTDLLREMSKLNSDEEKLAAVEQAKLDYGPRLRQVVKRSDNFGGKLRQRIKGVLGVIEKDPGAAIELDPRHVEEHLRVLNATVDMLNQVIKEQREALNAANIRDDGVLAGVVAPTLFRPGAHSQ